MRVLSWFSCGAASAYATYLALNDSSYASDEFKVLYCRVREEHEDSMRFLSDFEHVIGRRVEVLENEKYGGSVVNVIASTKFIKGPHGAPCTRLLKKDVRKAYQRDGDVQVFGYTAEEEGRANRFIDANNDVDCVFPLLEKGITKKQCLEFVDDMGITIPKMYRLGYQNNNCIGCVKGGMGYWNAIRVDFPAKFYEMAAIERVVGHSINKDANGPVYLDELDPKRGSFERDMPGDCGFTCEQSELFLTNS
jgi:hypothetical protein